MLVLRNVFFNHAAQGHSALNADAMADTSDTVTGANTDTNTEAEEISHLALEFTENPEISLIKYIEHIALLDPASAYNLAMLVLEDNILGPDLEKELILKLDDLKAAICEQPVQQSVSAFIDNGHEMTRAPVPATTPSFEFHQQLLKPAVFQPLPDLGI